jgi:hypothetical protein
MTPLETFLAYFQAFEQTYVDDDWTRLERFLAPEAVYRVRGGGGFDCEIQGRDAIFAGIRRFLDGFDRQCTREIRPVGAPALDANIVRVRGIAAYRRGESPELLLDIEEEAEFRDGVIVSLTDTYRTPVDEDMAAWIARWGEGLDPTYT